jgi:F0F1-type ATP synthase assembly protein I
MKKGESEEEAGGEQEATRRGGVAYAAGLTIFFAVATFMGIGWALDRWLGTSWIMVAGIILGSAVGFYEFIRIISQLNK